MGSGSEKAALGKLSRYILLKEDVAGQAGPRVDSMIRPQTGSGEGVSVGRIGNPLLKLEIATGVNPVPLLLGQ